MPRRMDLDPTTVLALIERIGQLEVALRDARNITLQHEYTTQVAMGFHDVLQRGVILP